MTAVLIAVVLAGRSLPVEEWIPRARRWMGEAGVWGPVAFVAGYVVATNLGVPGTPLTISAGVVFGWVGGLAVSVVASTSSACVTFVVSRKLGRHALASWLGERTLYRRIERLLEDRGAWVVALSRLVPFPFLLLNYSFGLTSVSFRTYAVWSTIGMIPMNLLFVAGGDALARWLARGEVPWTLLAVVAAVAVTGLGLAVVARRFLR